MKAGPLPGYMKVTWLSKISWRTAEAGPHHPRPYFAAVQNVSRIWQWFCSKMPLTLTSRFMETWLVEVIDSIVAVVYVFFYSVVKCVWGAADNVIADSAQGCSKYSELKNFPWGLKETVSSEKYILQPRAHNSILPMSVDTLPLTHHWLGNIFVFVIRTIFF